MRAVRCNALTGPADLVVEEIEPPVPADDEIRVRVHAASINFYDNLMVAGKYQMKPDLPFTAGSDAAGVVLETGARVSRLKPGDWVAIGHYIGAFADEMVAKEWTAVPMPDGVEFTHAAAMRVAHGTAIYGLARRASLKPGETLLVHGAAGGVGLAAVQLGRQLGATVIGTVGDAAKAQIVRDHGAAHVLTYDGEARLRDRVKELTGGDGADVIFDVVGGDVFDESLRCIAWDGRLLVVGFTSGRIPNAPANLVLLKHCSITGVFFGACMSRNHEAYRADAAQLLAWCASGELRPHVSMTFPLEDAVAAMTVLAERKATGKVVLTLEGGRAVVARVAKRVIVLALGWGFIVLGVVGLVVPILQGILFLLIGLALLSSESETARRILERLRARYPALSERIDLAEVRARRWWMRVAGRGGAAG